jgi:hypothetical protein
VSKLGEKQHEVIIPDGWGSVAGMIVNGDV